MPWIWPPRSKVQDTPSSPTSPSSPDHKVSSRSVIRPFFGSRPTSALAIVAARLLAWLTEYGNPDCSSDLKSNDRPPSPADSGSVLTTREDGCRATPRANSFNSPRSASVSASSIQSGTQANGGSGVLGNASVTEDDSATAVIF